MKPLLLRNALTQSKNQFIPKNPNDVTLYCCGPTVYDVPHLGHARTYVFMDILTRILRHHYGFSVRSVMNITDLDDKILAKGGPMIARQNEHHFFNIMSQLNIQRPDFTPRVTEFLETIHQMTIQCKQKGFAYDCLGSTYFETQKYVERYGRVFPQSEKHSTLHHPDKKDSRDFALWKQRHDESQMPGWHTECAALCAYHFGDSVDLHLGGIDLQFPHHENEISLGRVFFDTPQWVHCCLYTGHLMIAGRKMSKSLKNFTAVDDVFARGISPLALRYLFLKHPYDQPMHFNEAELDKAQRAYEGFMRHMQKVEILLQKKDEKPREEDRQRLHELNRLKESLDIYLSDNLNVPEAIRTLEQFMRELSTSIDKGGLSNAYLRYTFKYVRYIADNYFGLIETHDDENRCINLLNDLCMFRSKVRELALRDKIDSALKLCDETRDVLQSKGFVVEDAPFCNIENV